MGDASVGDHGGSTQVTADIRLSQFESEVFPAGSCYTY